MSVSTARKPSELIKYRYRLNKNFKQKDKTACINGITLNKDSWITFTTNQHKVLKSYIVSHKNPNGIVDELIYDPIEESEYAKTANKIKFFHKKKRYSRDILVTYKRKQLEEIAREYLIETKEKANTFLINCIMDEQAKYRESLVKTEDFFDETNKIPVEE